jgi:hypothetical protein
VTWTVERLTRSVRRLVGEGMVDRKVLAKAHGHRAGEAKSSPSLCRALL